MGKSKQNRDKVEGVSLLLLASFIWGTAFVAQSTGMDHVGPFTFYAARGYIGALVLLPVIAVISKIRKKDSSQNYKKNDNKKLLLGGVLCGILLFIASLLQQIGISQTTVGKAGFLTTLYIVIVPLLGIFMKKRPSITVWIAVAIALTGTALLSLTDDFTILPGDFYIIISALFFSLHILLVSRVISYVDGVKLSAIQLTVSATISLIVALISEKPDWTSIMDAAFPILYAGVMSSGIAYTLQIIGQDKIDETPASIIMSLESVFALLAGIVILHEEITPRGIAGSALLFISVILAQLPGRQNKNLKSEV